MGADDRVSILGTLEGNLGAQLERVAAAAANIDKSVIVADKDLNLFRHSLEAIGNQVKEIEKADLSKVAASATASANASDNLDTAQTRLIAKSSRLIQRIVSLQFALNSLSSAAPGGFGKLQGSVDASTAALGAFGSVASLFPNQFGLIAGAVAAAGAAINVFYQNAQKAEEATKALIDNIAKSRNETFQKKGSLIFDQVVGGNQELTEMKQQIENVKKNAIDAVAKVEEARNRLATARAAGDTVAAVRADFDLDKAALDAAKFLKAYNELSDSIDKRETISKVTKDLTELYAQFDEIDARLRLHVITPLQALEEKSQLAASKLKLAFDLKKAVPTDSIKQANETITNAAQEQLDAQKAYNVEKQKEQDADEEIRIAHEADVSFQKDTNEFLANQAKEKGQETNAFYQGIAQGIGSAFAEATGALIDGLIAGRLNFAEFAGQFLLQISKMILQAVVLKGVMAGLGVVGLSGGGTVPATGKAEGGPIFGPDVNADVVPAMLMPGEWVIRKDASDKYGPRVMAAINRGLIPTSVFDGFGASSSHNVSGHFADGGAVPFGAGATPKPATAFMVASDGELDRLLAGGDGAMLRFFDRNGPKIRTLLRVGGR